MPEILIVLGALPWLLIVLAQIFRRGFTVLLIWLLIAPAVTNLIQRTEQEVIYKSSGTEKSIYESDHYAENPVKVTWLKLLNPTRMLICVLFIIFIVNALLKKTHWVPLDRIEIWMSVFSLNLLANVVLLSGRLAFGLHVAFDAFIVPFLAYYVTRRLVSSEQGFHRLIRVIGYLGVWVIIFSLIDRFTTPDLFYRLKGPFPNRDHLYVSMAVIFFVVLSDLVSNKDPTAQKGALARSICWFVITLAPVIVLFTLTRGNWLGFVVGGSVLLFLVHRSLNFSTKLGLLSFVMMLIVVIAFSQQFLVPEELLEERVGDLSNIEGRFATWIAAVTLFTDAPIFGIGLNNLQGRLGTTMATFGEMSNYTTAHNSYLALLAELGLTGAVLFVMIQASIIRMGINLYRVGKRARDRWRGATVLALMASYTVPSLFEHLVFHPTVVHVYVYVFIGAIAGLYRRQGSVPALAPARVHRRRFAGCISTTRLPTNPASRF